MWRENGNSALISAPILLPTCEAWIPGSASPPRNDEIRGELVIVSNLRDYQNQPNPSSFRGREAEPGIHASMLTRKAGAERLPAPRSRRQRTHFCINSALNL
jgi:hypothetical protein